jgi:hypothetical protein
MSALPIVTVPAGSQRGFERARNTVVTPAPAPAAPSNRPAVERAFPPILLHGCVRSHLKFIWGANPRSLDSGYLIYGTISAGDFSVPVYNLLVVRAVYDRDESFQLLLTFAPLQLQLPPVSAASCNEPTMAVSCAQPLKLEGIGDHWNAARSPSDRE